MKDAEDTWMDELKALWVDAEYGNVEAAQVVRSGFTSEASDPALEHQHWSGRSHDWKSLIGFLTD